MSRLDELISNARSLLIETRRAYTPDAVYVGFSGGHDSLVTAHLVRGVFEDARCFHINTGIGIEATRRFVRQTCERYRWPLDEIRAREDCGQDYEALCLAEGFPGPPIHYKMFQRLKERGVRLLCARARRKRGRNIMLCTGIRKAESRRRMGYDHRIVDVIDSTQIWTNPIYHFSGFDVRAYIERFDLPRNPVVAVLGMSGECLCGAFARKGEKHLVRLVEPGTADYLDDLERRVWEAGWHWGWEDRPSKALIREKHGQGNLFMPLCVGCEKAA